MSNLPRGIRLLWSLIIFGMVISLGLISAPEASAAGSIKVAPTKGIAGETVKFTGNLPPKKARNVVLQRKSGSKWVKVKTAKTTKAGKFTIKTKVRSSTTTYRVHAPAAKISGKKYKAAATSAKKVTTQPQTGSLKLMRSTVRGVRTKATATFKPARKNRVVKLQLKSGSKWVTVASGKQNSKGKFTFNIPTDKTGKLTYRAATKAHKGAKSAFTKTKTIRISRTGIVAWGNSGDGLTDVPLGLTNAKAIAAGGYHSVALKEDGTVATWGYNDYGQIYPPPGLKNVVAIAAGEDHILALRRNGTVAAWGFDYFGQSSVPSKVKDIQAISAGYGYNLALKHDGTVVAWGLNDYGQARVPSGLKDVTAVAAGGWHGLALKQDGTVVAWGYNEDGRARVPSGLTDVKAIAAGGTHSLALKNDGTVVAWGGNYSAQTDIPSGLKDVTAVAAGYAYSLALKKDGTVVAWGDNTYGLATVPSGLKNVVAISASQQHNLALVK